MLTDDLIATFSSAQAAFTARVHAVAPDQWQLGTPDTQWTVADLVGHLVDEHRWATPLLAGLDMDAARAVVAGLGTGGRGRDRPRPRLGPGRGQFGRGVPRRRRADRFGRHHPGFGSGGGVPRGNGARPDRARLDLGVATGYPGPLPAGAVAAIYPLAQAIVDRTPAGMFAPPVDAAADVPVIDRLVALTGRRPRPA